MARGEHPYFTIYDDVPQMMKLKGSGTGIAPTLLFGTVMSSYYFKYIIPNSMYSLGLGVFSCLTLIYIIQYEMVRNLAIAELSVSPCNTMIRTRLFTGKMYLLPIKCCQVSKVDGLRLKIIY